LEGLEILERLEVLERPELLERLELLGRLGLLERLEIWLELQGRLEVWLELQERLEVLVGFAAFPGHPVERLEVLEWVGFAAFPSHPKSAYKKTRSESMDWLPYGRSPNDQLSLAATFRQWRDAHSTYTLTRSITVLDASVQSAIKPSSLNCIATIVV